MMDNRLTKTPSIAIFNNIKRYWDKDNDIAAARILPGEYYVTMENELVVTNLGSCIAACIRDKENGIGGMNHFMLPEIKGHSYNQKADSIVGDATRYGNYAMEHLINTVLSNGGKRKNLEVKVFGGSKIDSTKGKVGLENIDFVLDFIDTEALALVSQDLGGSSPRKVVYYPKTGKVWIKRIANPENNNLIRQESQYRRSIIDIPVISDIELF